ncbi:hypothetical protein [Bowmanella denitrificans]|nr:hypothetical protein [Bowmanella denitrificans]
MTWANIDAFLAGQQAAAEGQPHSANPWPITSPYHQDWLDGWHHA